MNGDRDEILDRIRRAKRPAGAGATERASAPPAPIPARARGDRRTLRDRFRENAERVGATLATVDHEASVPAVIADYLRHRNLPVAARVAPDLAALPWDAAGIAVAAGAAEDGDAVAITGAFAGIAETGTLMLTSAESPTTLNFLPDTHVVALRASAIVGGYEDAWMRLRRRGAGFIPRMVNWITGPSRTADIEQTILIGMHGPRRLHIVLLDDEA